MDIVRICFSISIVLYVLWRFKQIEKKHRLAYILFQVGGLNLVLACMSLISFVYSILQSTRGLEAGTLLNEEKFIVRQS
jgi:hypothetical protein